MNKVMTDAERADARRIIAVQASTMPRRPGQADTPLAPLPAGEEQIDIGPYGAWIRGACVRVGSAGERATHLGDQPVTVETTGMGTGDSRRRAAVRIL